MPSPLAHVGVALALHVALARPGTPTWGRGALAVAAASVAPDLDILAVIVLPGGLAWHHGPTHSVVGALLIGVLVCLAARRRGPDAPAVVAGALLHVPMDWSTGTAGTPASYGVPWAWPLSSERSIDADPWFGAFHIDRAGFLANMATAEAMPVYGRELLTVAACAGVAAWVRRRRGRGAR